MIAPEGCEVYIWTSGWAGIVGCSYSEIFCAREILGGRGEKGGRRKRQLYFEAHFFNKHAFPINKPGDLFGCTVPVWVGLHLHMEIWQHRYLTHQIETPWAAEWAKLSVGFCHLCSWWVGLCSASSTWPLEKATTTQQRKFVSMFFSNADVGRLSLEERISLVVFEDFHFHFFSCVYLIYSKHLLAANFCSIFLNTPYMTLVTSMLLWL